MDFEGKTVLITGGAGGIGSASAMEFASRGAQVAIADLDTARGAQVKGELEKTGATAHFLEVDLSQRDSYVSLIETALERMGRLDVLVNNAGILFRVGTPETTPEMWYETLDVNLSAPFFLSQRAAIAMKEQGGGAIVNLSSELGIYADAGTVSYCVSKAGIVQLTKAMALDFARDNIRINAVAPGETHTLMTEDAIRQRGMTLEQGLARFARRVPLRKVGKPQEIANLIVFLASDAASFITGTTVSADGGTSAAGPGGVADDQ